MIEWFAKYKDLYTILIPLITAILVTIVGYFINLRLLREKNKTELEKAISDIQLTHGQNLLRSVVDQVSNVANLNLGMKTYLELCHLENLPNPQYFSDHIHTRLNRYDELWANIQVNQTYCKPIPSLEILNEVLMEYVKIIWEFIAEICEDEPDTQEVERIEEKIDSCQGNLVRAYLAFKVEFAKSYGLNK